jgi:hypothetical protein
MEGLREANGLLRKRDTQAVDRESDAIFTLYRYSRYLQNERVSIMTLLGLEPSSLSSERVCRL